MKKYDGAFSIETSVNDDDSVNLLFEKASEKMYQMYTVSPIYRQLVDCECQRRVTLETIKSTASLEDMKREYPVSNGNPRLKKRNCC